MIPGWNNQLSVATIQQSTCNIFQKYYLGTGCSFQTSVARLDIYVLYYVSLLVILTMIWCTTLAVFCILLHLLVLLLM